MRVDYRQLKPYRDYHESRLVDRRLLVLQLLVVLGFVLYVAVFWYLQVVRGEEYRLQAEENRLRRLPERPVRGLLRDRHGELLATNRPSFAVFVDRERTRDAEQEVRELARFLGEPPEPMLDRLEAARSAPRFVPTLILPDVGLEVAARIEAHRPELPAIDVEMDPKRFYPLRDAAAHVLGYLSESSPEQVKAEGLLPGSRVGQTGLELAYDDTLRGKAGVLLEEVNARGRPLRTVATMESAVHGEDLAMTLDAALQRELHEAYAGRGGAAVFLDPNDGAILALYSGPSFDPNLFSGRLSSEQWSALVDNPARPLQNRAVSSVYSPGSTFKIIMAAAAIEEGAATTSETIFCGGHKSFYGRRRHCHFRGGHGWVALQKAIQKSCNIWFYTVGQRLGIDAIERWSRRFGLGAITGVSLPAEVAGLVPSDAWSRRARGHQWYPGDTISVAIGQGPINVTPIQMARVAAVIANGGRLVYPYLDLRAGPTRRPDPIGLSSEARDTVAAGLTAVVESSGGTARRARVPGIRVAGKTGTAQVVALDAENDPGDHAWFVGFAPVDDPQLAFAILVEHAGGGGRNAAPIASRVIQRFLDGQEFRDDLSPLEEALPIARADRTAESE